MASKGDRQGSIPLAQVDAMVRSRLAEIGAAAGVSHGRVGVEVLYKLPAGLVQAYELLWDLSIYGEGSDEVDGSKSRKRAARAGEVGVESDPDNRGGGAGGRTRDTDRSRQRYGELVVRSGGSARRGARGSSRGSDVSVANGVERGDLPEGGGSHAQQVAEIRARADKRLRQVARDVLAELAALGLGIDTASGEMMVRVSRTSSSKGGMRDAIDDASRKNDAT